MRPLKNAPGKLKHIKLVPAHLHAGKLRKFNRSLYRSGRLRLKCDGTRAETRFSISAKRTSPFKSAGASVQSTTGSRGVPISGSNAGYTMFRGSVKGTGYPLHSPVSPSLPLLCVTMCHHISTGVYCIRRGEKRGCWLWVLLKTSAICLKSAKMRLWRTFQKMVDNLWTRIDILYVGSCFPCVDIFRTYNNNSSNCERHYWKPWFMKYAHSVTIPVRSPCFVLS